MVIESRAVKDRICFQSISSKAWEHPADRAALSALERVPGLDHMLRKYMAITTEQSLRLIALASSVRVTDQQFSNLHRLFRESCRILDVSEMPELYVAQDPFLNAGAVGVDQPFIVLNSALIERLDDDEIMALLGHELGHCMSGHVLYKTLLQLLIMLSAGISNVPLGATAMTGIILALKEWDRKSELSADRAGLLVAQDPYTYYSLLMKMSGGSDYAQMDINAFFLQAAEYDKSTLR